MFIIIIIFICLNLIDMFSTIIGYRKGLYESNPIVRYLLGKIYLLIFLKLFVVFISIYLFFLFQANFYYILIVSIISICYGVVCINNILQFFFKKRE